MTVTVFGLRILFLVALYGFLAMVAWLVWRELKAGERLPAGSPSKRAVRLTVIRAGDSGYPEGKFFDLGAVTTMGRDLANDIVIADSYASSRHARIVKRDDRFFVEDIGSSNGTLHNGLRLPPNTPAPLGPGDVIQIGKVEFKRE